jgi:hypothetical protein
MTLTSDDLIWHLVEEASTIKLETSVNKAHAALATAHGRPNKGPSKNGKGKDSKGKNRKSIPKCTNCKLKGHTSENCYAKGGGKEHQAPDWWKQKQEAKGKEAMKKESVNSAAESSSKRENHAYITISPLKTASQDDRSSTALVVTSGHNHEAFGVSASTDLIIDCGASSHFSPDKSKFVNFEVISPEPIRATDGHTFSVTGHGDLIVTLPVKSSEHGVGPPITLKWVYYAPQMVFTLISVACLDKAGCSLTIEDGECIIRSPRPYRTLLGSVPHIDNLYRLNSSAIKAPEPPRCYANVAYGPISLGELHRLQTLHDMIRNGAVEGMELDSSPTPTFCEACIQGKAHRKAFPKISETSYSHYGEKVVTDLWGWHKSSLLADIIMPTCLSICSLENCVYRS